MALYFVRNGNNFIGTRGKGNPYGVSFLNVKEAIGGWVSPKLA
jgi:hypothetical protein